MLTVHSILVSLHEWAPRAIAWERDNIGLLLGSSTAEVRTVLVCLDITPKVVQEAIERDAQVIVSHHPLIFHPLRSIDTDTEKGAMIATLLRHDIAVIAAHTNADAARYGLNRALAMLLGLGELHPLDVVENKMQRLTLHVRSEEPQLPRVSEFLQAHGEISWYAHALQGGMLAIDIELPEWQLPRLRSDITRILGTSDSSWRTQRLSDALPQHGIGMVGVLAEAIPAAAFVRRVKEQLHCSMLRTSVYAPEQPVRRIAVCTGSGSSYLSAARSSGADLYVTGDLSHHDFLDYSADMVLVDAGHHETEYLFIELCVNELRNTIFEDNQKIDILVSRTDTNPLRFM